MPIIKVKCNIHAVKLTTSSYEYKVSSVKFLEIALNC